MICFDVPLHRRTDGQMVNAQRQSYDHVLSSGLDNYNNCIVAWYVGIRIHILVTSVSELLPAHAHPIPNYLYPARFHKDYS